MAIKVGNSWVSEAAYNYAKQAAESAPQDGMLQGLADKFPETKFSTNTAPFQGKGANNIAIAPNILRQMENDPEKRLEYEALVYDCANLQKSFSGKVSQTGKKLVSQGFIIDSNGGLSAWSISKSGGDTKRASCLLPRHDKSLWLGKMLGGLGASNPAALYQKR